MVQFHVLFCNGLKSVEWSGHITNLTYFFGAYFLC